MRLIPVLDVLDGQVVRGIAGQRDEYKPIVSALTDSAEPVAVAIAIRETLGLSDLYLADLDGLMRNEPNFALIDELSRGDFRLIVDVGIRSREAAARLSDLPNVQPVIALESTPNSEQLSKLLAGQKPERFVFSLDLKHGVPMASNDWPAQPLEIARHAYEIGIRNLIVLDLSSVGSDAGVSTLPLCRELDGAFPDVSLITGGGIRNALDCETVAGSGVSGLLVSSALHNGNIGRAEVDQLAASHRA